MKGALRHPSFGNRNSAFDTQSCNDLQFLPTIFVDAQACLILPPTFLYNKQPMSKNVVIIGNGIAGVTAARYIRKWSDFNITIISAETKHFFSRTALMYIYMGHMRYQDTKPYEDHFWEKNRIDLIHDRVTGIDAAGKSLSLEQGNAINYDVLIIATGSKSRFFGWPGQDLKGVQGLYGIPDLEAMETYTKDINRAVVVGGGLIGIEMVEMLHSRNIPVTFLVRETNYFEHLFPLEESQIINQEIRDHHVDLQLQTELKEALGDNDGRVRAIVSSKDEEIPCQFLGLTTGVAPNIGIVEASDVETNRGVLVDEFLQTNMPDVYAIGDCAEFREDGIGYRRIDQLWYTGRHQGKTVARTICGVQQRYNPPLFFNSAKFFSIEYQTYGTISAKPEEGIETLLWISDRKKELIRINYRKDNQQVVGFNLLGIRFRHALCEKWLLEKRTIDYVLTHLAEANFDPEFYKKYEPELVATYNRQNPDNPVQMAPKKGVLANIFG